MSANSGRAEFRIHKMLFPLADAVFAGTGAIHRQRALGNALYEGLGIRDFIRIIHFDQRAGMEIAVAHMANNWRDDAAELDVALGFYDAFRETGNRHAHIRDCDARSSAIRFACPECVVARLP